MKKSIITAMTAFLVSSAVPAAAELVFPLLSYRTGAYAPNGIPIADGFSDYLTLINERDGGIGGEKIKMIECETAYNTEKAWNVMKRQRGKDLWSIGHYQLGLLIS